MASENSEFVKYVSHPKTSNFECYIFSEEQLMILNKLKPVTLHVDATGTVIRPTTLKKKKQEKRLLYYAAVIKANDHMMPVAEFVSTDQSTTAISSWLYAFKLFATERGFDLSDLIANVTSDFSTAIIKSLAQTFNECKDVIDYLDQCYDYLYVNKPMKSKIILNLCCCHLVKNISDDVFKYYGAAGKTNKKIDLARIVVGFVTPAFDLKMVNYLDKCFTALCTIILSPYQNGDVQKFIDFLIELNNSVMMVLNSKEYKDFENILFLNSDGTQVDDLKTNPLSKEKYKASKFYGRFAKMSRDIRASFTLDNEGVANEFYNEEYFSDFMGSVVPVIPMWTCLMIRVYSKTEVCHRPNNSGVELWFHYLKGNSLQAKSMKFSRFIRLTRDRIESLAKEVLCDIPNTRFKTVTDLSDDEDAEQWKPRKNKKIGYFMQGSLMANMKKFKPNQVIHEKAEIVDLTTISDENKQITESNMITPRSVQTVKTFSTPGSYS
ncbi:ULP PROTEASE domain-containing protein [Aphis craccivora]|uniref:ULP PROTEASE domain-containing protein n=1 Tax=Aphis craccivora TaxID=307492 RepID=A0A6G0ZC57_APHCR|nr:ULP PROTEASE domain-containing protein [Aphis craccivora]